MTAALPVLGQHAHEAGSGGESPGYTPKVLSAAELETTRRLAEHIIPKTDTPGAAEVGVHLLIDRALNGRPKESKAFRAGLRKFAKLDAAAQVEALKALAARKDPFFKMLKNMTIDGYYSTREGLAGELGWKGLTPVAEFKGCTHPEHQA